LVAPRICCDFTRGLPSVCVKVRDARPGRRSGAPKRLGRRVEVLKKSLSYVDALWGRSPPAWQEGLIPRRVLETFSPLGRGFSRESRLWVRKALQELLAAKLGLHTIPDCTIELNRLKPALTPRGLIGAIWLLAAQAAAGERDVIACGYCDGWITVGRVKGGRRMDTKFCSDSCRVGSYQSRSRHAGKLLHYGLTPERVAFYSGLSRRALRRRLRK
jgi:hypothetical protein